MLDTLFAAWRTGSLAFLSWFGCTTPCPCKVEGGYQPLPQQLQRHAPPSGVLQEFTSVNALYDVMHVDIAQASAPDGDVRHTASIVPHAETSVVLLAMYLANWAWQGA